LAPSPICNPNTTPIAHATVTPSTHFPNVDISNMQKSPLNTTMPLSHVMILHGQCGTPTQLLIPIPTKLATSDPTWDQFQHLCNGFTQSPTLHQHVLHNCAFSTTLEYTLGATWMHYTSYGGSNHQLIPPWQAYHPDHDDELLHIPTTVPNEYVDHDLFLSSFT